MAKKKTRVRGYTRKRYGKLENVSGYSRSKGKRKSISRANRRRIVSGKSKRLSGRGVRYALFSEPKYKKYSNIVSFESEDDAIRSSMLLLGEFATAKSRDKQLRVARVTQYAANRAKVSARRKNLSEKERKELRKISKQYRQAAVSMWESYRK